MLPVAVVNDDRFFGSASDGIMVLEEADVAPGVRQQGVVRHRVAALHGRVAGVGQRQAVKDLCPPEATHTEQSIRAQTAPLPPPHKPHTHTPHKIHTSS